MSRVLLFLPFVISSVLCEIYTCIILAECYISTLHLKREFMHFVKTLLYDMNNV